MTAASLLLASPCYGGVAIAAYMRSVLELRAACARDDITLELDLGGGEALLARGRAGMLARFVASAASHLLMADSDKGFDTDAVLSHLQVGPALTLLNSGALLIRREAAQQLREAHPEQEAGLGDVRNAAGGRAAMVFDAMVDPATGGYVADVDALLRRWEAVQGVGNGPRGRSASES